MSKQITMKRDKECKGSVRFVSDDPDAAITNVYLSRACPGANHAKAVTITVTIDPASLPAGAPLE